MKHNTLFFTIICLLALAACTEPTDTSEAPVGTPEHVAPLISKIAFGSCGHESEPQPVLNLAANKNPDLFIWLGDNIYGDTYEMDTLQAKYNRLAAKTEFQRLKDTAAFLATWDDHDYGWNDSGRHYPFKEQSKEIFLDFWEVPAVDVRRERPGIYTSHFYSDGEDTLQVIVLDMRTFRDDLRRYEGQAVDTSKFFYGLDYWPYETNDSTLLGESQWQWLEEQLRMPADVRLVASSTQFGISYNGYEAWANFPHERQRFLDLIKKTRAEGLLFISGDVHYAEISEIQQDSLYPIYDVTASGITSTWGFATPNDNRIAGPVMENHFGLIEIDWSQEDPTLDLQIYDVSDSLRIEKTVRLSSLQF